MEDKDKLIWYEKKYGQIIEKRGLNNWKNLFKKPTFQDWIILFMLIIALFSVYAYNHDIAECREFIKQQKEDFNPPIILDTTAIINFSFEVEEIET